MNIQSALANMCKSAVIFALMVAMAMASPAERKSQQARGGEESQPEGQIEGYDSEDAASMANKVMECRSVLQQAGMIDFSTPGKATESENETEEPDKMGERMAESGSKSRRSFRRY